MLRRIVLGAAAAALSLGIGGASANPELLRLQRDPNQWVMPTGNYANWRYSELNQITRDNVRNLRPSWQFSTGVLRGHEGGPLVIGDVMYIHTPFPNRVFAMDLNDPGKRDLALRAAAGSERHRRDVLRHRQPRPGLCRRQDHPEPGRHHPGRARRQDRQARCGR